jgi:hypothetical protein
MLRREASGLIRGIHLNEMVGPAAPAVLRLTISLNVVAGGTSKSAHLAPFGIRPAPACRRNSYSSTRDQQTARRGKHATIDPRTCR